MDELDSAALSVLSMRLEISRLERLGLTRGEYYLRCVDAYANNLRWARLMYPSFRSGAKEK